MQKIVLQQPPKEALKIKALLDSLEFEMQFLNSLKYVSQKLASLSSKDVLKIREAFTKCPHPRFAKSFSYHLPFGTKAAYEKQMEKASLEKLVELIRVCSFLLQTKVYLFWRSAHYARNINLITEKVHSKKR